LARKILTKLKTWEDSKIELKTAKEIVSLVEEEYE